MVSSPTRGGSCYSAGVTSGSIRCCTSRKGPSRFPRTCAGPVGWVGRVPTSKRSARLRTAWAPYSPASYRQFLLTSDGWLNTTSDIERILSAHEVGWTRDLDPDLVTVWSEADGAGARIADEEYFVYGEAQAPFLLRPEYMPHTLKISHTPEATDVYLLNPCVVTADGEWEAWFVAHWLPGAVRYQSFWDLMNDEYRRFRGDW